MKLVDFTYDLPKELIAQYPLKARDEARLLVLKRKEEKIEHRIFKEVADYFSSGDLMVLNDTKVLPSRLIGRRLSGGKVEFLLLEHLGELVFNTLIKPSRIKIQEKIVFNGGRICAEVVSKNRIKFSCRSIDDVYGLGKMPLPPYIKRTPENLDNRYYQTVYARKEGAVASPTAGLHFTPELIRKVEALNVNIAYLTLHINYATFRPVKSEDIAKHKMDKEYFKISNEAVGLLEQATINKARIFAVGTTSCRALETYAHSGLTEGYTDLFIYPGYKFGTVDGLITNFHLPKTTLFILICAFAGEKLIKKAYQEAIAKKYRFYSYGDAMLII